ncbi:unnamed protein product, partial [Toxocara canis]|uniref:Uncharacterized protein n=1 Tax=Toxocara canis TaxID=6265 RepID=A0A183V5J9_TOXCA
MPATAYMTSQISRYWKGVHQCTTFGMCNLRLRRPTRSPLRHAAVGKNMAQCNGLYYYTNDSSLESYPPMFDLSTTPGFEPAIFGYVDPRDVHCARRPLGKTLRAEKRASANLCLRKCQGASNRLYDYTNDPSLESYPPVLDIWNVQSSAPSADAFSIAPRGRWEKHGAL